MVAMPFGLGKLFRKSSKPAKTERRSRLGIRGSLFVAFTVIAATSIVIAGGASYLLRSLDDITIDLSKRDIPRMASSQQLSTLAESLASRAPALMRAPRRRGARRAAEATEGYASRGPGQDQAARRAEGAMRRSSSGLEENVKNLDAMINSLNSAARERLDTMATRDKQFAAMRAAHAAAIGSIDTAITDARINMNTALGEQRQHCRGARGHERHREAEHAARRREPAVRQHERRAAGDVQRHDRKIQGRAEGHPQADRR